MHWKQLEVHWPYFKGTVRGKWRALTQDDLDHIDGRRDQLLGVLQYRYGRTRDEVEREVSEFERDISDARMRVPVSLQLRPLC